MWLAMRDLGAFMPGEYIGFRGTFNGTSPRPPNPKIMVKIIKVSINPGRPDIRPKTDYQNVLGKIHTYFMYVRTCSCMFICSIIFHMFACKFLISPQRFLYFSFILLSASYMFLYSYTFLIQRNLKPCPPGLKDKNRNKRI